LSHFLLAKEAGFEKVIKYCMGEKFQLAVAQCVSLAGNVDANLEEVERLCLLARGQGADLILFPECHASGYSYKNLSSLVVATAETLSGRIVRRLSELARAHELVVCCGMFERDENRFYNTQVVAFPDGRVDRQRKGVTACAETEVISLDPTRRVFEWAGTRFGVLVCADSAMGNFREQFAALNITLLLHPCAGRILQVGPYAKAGAQKESDAGFQAGCLLAATMGVTYAAANPIGFSGEDYFPGNSWIIQPDGRHSRLAATALPAEMQPALAFANVQGLQMA